MQIIQELARGFGKFVKVFVKHVPEVSMLTVDDFIHPLVEFGKFVVLADLSIRHKGFKNQLNVAREEIVRKIRDDFDEEKLMVTLEKELDPIKIKAFKTMLRTLRKNFETLILSNDPSLNCVNQEDGPLNFLSQTT
jgi:hypothetical protein